MGWLSKLLNPVADAKRAIKGVSSLAKGDVKGFVDPENLIWKDKAASSSPKVDPSTAPTDPTDPAQYQGDTQDDGYGSFADPFDVEAFYRYQDPGYAFRLQQGSQAVQNRNSAGSGALSGAAYKDLIDYNQGQASTEYGNAFNRYQTQQGNIFSRLSALAQLGQSAAAGVGSQGTALAGQAGQFLSNAGTAQGAGIVGAGNAISNGATNAWLWGSDAGRSLTGAGPV